jgi:tight adherence protein B
VTTAGYALALLAGSAVVGLVGLAQLLAGRAQQRAMQQRTALDVVEARAALPWNRLEAGVLRTRWARRLAGHLAAGGVTLRVVDYLAMSIGITAVAYLVARMLLPQLFALACAAAAAHGCWRWVRRRQLALNEEFIGQLPDLARVLSNSASAGLAVPSAIELACSELDEPAASQLEFVVQQLRIGQSVDAALAQLRERVPSREVSVLVSTLAIQQRSGGDIVGALRDMAATLEARKDLRREIRTTMAGAVSTGYLVVFMGVGSLLLVNAMQPGALDALLRSGGGRVALVLAGLLFATGFFVIQRITRIET